jgi:hypothetical protein
MVTDESEKYPGEFIRLWDEEAAPYTPELNKDPLSDYYHFE